MERRDPGDLPRWLGFALAASGLLLTVLIAVIWAAFAVAGEWPDEWWLLVGLTAIAGLSNMAGFRILRAHREAR
jgi:hypothetical protein